MYIALSGSPLRTYVDELGMDMRPVQGPNIAPGVVWPEVWVYYWATQMTFVDNAGVEMGGGHFGLQCYGMYDGNPSDLPADWTQTVINWGVYDSTIGGLAVFRNSGVLTPNTFADINTDVSFGFRWQYGHWYRFRVYKSPKQDWVANEIRPGSLQVPPYVGTDQQSDEVAFRMSVQDLTAGSPPIEFHDVLVKSPATVRPMGYGISWTEPISQPSYALDLSQTWVDNPICDFRHQVWDGPSAIPQYEITYGATSSNCNVSMVSGTPGYARMAGGTTRTNPGGTILSPPSGFWDPAPANVTPNITDVTTRTPTTRPWY